MIILAKFNQFQNFTMNTETYSKLKKKTQFLNELIMSEERVVLCIEKISLSFQKRRYQKHAVVT
jgi:hypothetical protein